MRHSAGVGSLARAVAALAWIAFTPAGAAAHLCTGDCDGDDRVAIDELVTGVSLALGLGGDCLAIDADGDGTVAIHELIRAVGYALAGCPPPPAYPRDDTLRLNHIQVLGSHNSYHVRADDAVFAIITQFSQDLAESVDYSHRPLPEQFEEQGIRQIELDVFADPAGGLYASPLLLQVTTGDPNARIPGMDAPGFKVLHVQDLDYKSTCVTFVECLQAVKAWSDAHPGHAPLMILVEAKDDVLPSPFVIPVEIGPEELDALDAEIRSVFLPAQLITPDEVRGEHATLEEAIRTDGWPTLGAARGRVLVCLDNGGRIKDAYVAGHPSLQGRVMFTSSEPPEPEAAFVKLNDPIGDFDRIQQRVGEGFIVRTRADADTVEARTGDTTPRDAALASGAQFVSTDYPVPDPRFTDYRVQIPAGTPARCNPISAPLACDSLDVENPEHLTDR